MLWWVVMATPNWKSLEGKLLEGGYEVEECFHSGPSSASFRIRILGDRFTSAYGEFFAPGSVSGAEFALWAETRTLQHPNVSTPLATGQYRLDAQELPYVIRVRPDETLQDTIAERALTTEEAREVVTAVVRALQFLHGNGFVQTTLSPREIVAIGDSIKLSINGIRRINTPIKEMDEPTTAADIRKLGAMTCEILTQRSSEPEIAQAAKTLPSPFNRIVERCVDPDPQKRCSLPDILAMLRGEQLATPPSPERATIAPKAMAAVAGAGTIAQTMPRVDVRGASQPRPLAETERVKASQPALPNTARSRPVDHEISAATAPAIR
ncbi:MAG: hypothetical protein JO061_06045, partial [Acidobacteriaceae bacterium]|nr:hypothetical protein [Acidobacteriaceae bacterium]